MWNGEETQKGITGNVEEIKEKGNKFQRRRHFISIEMNDKKEIWILSALRSTEKKKNYNN